MFIASANNLKPVIGDPLVFSGSTSNNVMLLAVEETKTGAKGFSGFVAAKMYEISPNGPQPLKFFALY